MKGYQMVLLVNAGICFLLAFGTLGYAKVLERGAHDCTPDPNATPPVDCARPVTIAQSSYRVAGWLLTAGVLLLGTGVAVGWIRPKPPSEPPPPAGGNP